MGAAPDEPLVLGTAGHVDHGKTALVLALTGRDTDRLEAEKARGISIELGFAPLVLPSGRRVSLVDVPGHERFVRHMVAGATGVDGYLLCLAADDGVMPQTREHLAVLGLLGVRSGVVAVTRADLADPAPAAAEVAALVGPDVEVVPVCAPRGEGIDDLRAALDRLTGALRPRLRAGPPPGSTPTPPPLPASTSAPRRPRRGAGSTGCAGTSPPGRRSGATWPASEDQAAARSSRPRRRRASTATSSGLRPRSSRRSTSARSEEIVRPSRKWSITRGSM